LKNSLQTLEGIYNVAIGCCNIPTQKTLFGIFLIRFANLKNSLQTLEGIYNVPIGCCNIPMQKNPIWNFPH
jgi:hypothetical protein